MDSAVAGSEPTPMPFPTSGAREYPRVPIRSAGSGRSQNQVLDGSVRNVSLGGALFLVPGEVTVPSGTGLEITFRLPAGEQLRIHATVRWSKPGTPAGWCSLGLQFQTLTGPQKSYIEHYVETVAAAGVESAVKAEAHEKYRIAFDAAGRLRMMLAGLVTPDEAKSFRDTVSGRLEARKPPRVHFEVDARGLSVCCPATVAHIRDCFSLLASKSEVFGLFVGSNSLATVQLLRIAREAGLADAIFSVNEVEEADRIWQQLECA